MDTPEEDAPSPARDGWLRRRLLPDGTDPDPRFTLANERTFLAWTRTALALVGGGLAVDAFTGEVWGRSERKLVALLLLAIGVVCSVGAFVHWVRSERAMRRGVSIPVPILVPILTAVSVVATLVVLAVILRGQL
ncbi:conserved membrane hypothetical protein [Nostocoides japonicum T1-X7]|uniref:DUF202 domain-containing protein n=1 Tax=Nostocoides japonicum T1-X7 TaxID=1194083 RepID=A0A077M4C9_9MICO|nr:DUF202 domain-containing protein [Tetrasphaera japonica]CCH78994.1 conserved membrane hypothetical protein [Tetrasphaera japonica T1-X7]